MERDAAPFPGASRTLARPFLNLTGRRHVPVLVNANRVPFLRIKKPQPPFLSRIIRDTVKLREHRLEREARLSREIPFAKDEDEWDQILYEYSGVKQGSLEDPPWRREVRRAFDTNHKQQVAAIQKRTDLSAKLFAIVEQEKALAQEEKIRSRSVKNKARKARQLARRGWTESEIQEKLYPQTEEESSGDAPASTEKVPEPSEGEVQPPNPRNQQRQKKGNHTMTEKLRRLYETTIRPRTEKETAWMKEAKVRRKEEKAEKKAQKEKRKEENAASRAEKLKDQEVLQAGESSRNTGFLRSKTNGFRRLSMTG